MAQSYVHLSNNKAIIPYFKHLWTSMTHTYCIVHQLGCIQKSWQYTHQSRQVCTTGGSGLPLQRPSSKQNVFSQSSHSNCISYFSKALTHYEKILGSMTFPGRDNSGAIDSIKNEHLHQHMYGSCCEFSSGHELSDIVYALQQLRSRNWTLSSMAESEPSYQGGISR